MWLKKVNKFLITPLWLLKLKVTRLHYMSWKKTKIPLMYIALFPLPTLVRQPSQRRKCCRRPPLPPRRWLRCMPPPPMIQWRVGRGGGLPSRNGVGDLGDWAEGKGGPWRRRGEDGRAVGHRWRGEEGGWVVTVESRRRATEKWASGGMATRQRRAVAEEGRGLGDAWRGRWMVTRWRTGRRQTGGGGDWWGATEGGGDGGEELDTACPAKVRGGKWKTILLATFSSSFLSKGSKML